MRVLFGSSGLSAHFGGSAFSEATLIGQLNLTTQLTLLCREDKLEPHFVDNFGITQWNLYKPWQTALAWIYPGHKLNQLFKNADVYHLNGHWKLENFFLTRLARRHRVPYVLHPRGMLLIGHRSVQKKKIFNALFGNKIVEQAAKIIALSQFEVDQFRPYGIPDSKVQVIPNAIDTHQPREVTSTTDPFFVYLGRVEARKNLLFLLDAFSIYRNGGGKASLWFVGPVERGYDETVKEKIKTLRLEDCVKLKPAVYGQEKSDLIRFATGVIYPTREEAFGRVPFETVAEGTAVIIPRQSGSAEYLWKFIPHCIYEDDNMQSLAGVMKEIDNREDDLGVKKAGDWVRTELDPRKIATHVLALYHALVDVNPSLSVREARLNKR